MPPAPKHARRWLQVNIAMYARNGACQMAQRTSMRLCCLSACLVGAIASCAHGSDDAASKDRGSVTYVLEEAITYFGIAPNQRTQISFRRDTSLCEVAQQGRLFISEDRKASSFRDEHREIEPNNVARTSWAFTLEHGKRSQPVLPIEIDVPMVMLFTTDMPTVGFERFYLPMVRRTGDEATLSDEKVARMRSDNGPPQFSGEWVFDHEEHEGRVRIMGPFVLETENRGCVIGGAFDHEIMLKPFRILRMSGHSVIRIRPPAGENLMPSTTVVHRPNWFERFDELAGEFRFRMVPIDSEEGKSISIPQALKDAPRTE